MNLSLDEAQQILVDTFADFFARECPSSLVRETEAEGFSPELWSRLIELGAPGMGLPMAVGGIDSGMLELGLVSVACGRVLAPLPFVEVVSASRVLAGRPEGTSLLPKVVSGSERLSLVLESRARNEAEKTLVPAGRVVDHAIGFQDDALVLWFFGRHREFLRHRPPTWAEGLTLFGI